jgi:hypothetical protein
MKNSDQQILQNEKAEGSQGARNGSFPSEEDITQKEIYSDRSRVVGIDYLQLLETASDSVAELRFGMKMIWRVRRNCARQYLARERRVEEWFVRQFLLMWRRKRKSTSRITISKSCTRTMILNRREEATLVLKEFTKHPDYEVTVSGRI